MMVTPQEEYVTYAVYAAPVSKKYSLIWGTHQKP